MTDKPRIWKVTYRRMHKGKRVRTIYTKVPYGTVFSMTEILTRMAYVREIIWFRIEVASGKEIANNRSSLERWLPLLTRDKYVDWTA